jgi:C4-dicarboxylate transporter
MLLNMELWAAAKMYADERYREVIISAFMEELRDRLTDIQKEKVEQEQLSIYSGHDYTIIPLMASLGMTIGMILCRHDYSHMSAYFLMSVGYTEKEHFFYSFM